jgi:hypothetical protein
MGNYYRVLYDGDERYGVGYVSPPRTLTLPYKGVVKKWTPLSLLLRDGEFPDYLASCKRFGV